VAAAIDTAADPMLRTRLVRDQGRRDRDEESVAEAEGQAQGAGSKKLTTDDAHAVAATTTLADGADLEALEP
jgi:hypothetical protein